MKDGQDEKEILAINKMLLQYLQNAVEVCNTLQQRGANESYINLAANMLLEKYNELAKSIEFELGIITIEDTFGEVID